VLVRLPELAPLCVQAHRGRREIQRSCIDSLWNTRSPDEIERTSNAYWSRMAEGAAARTVLVRDALVQRAQRTRMRSERESELQAKFRVASQAHRSVSGSLAETLARELGFLFEDRTGKKLRTLFSAHTANYRQAPVNETPRRSSSPARGRRLRQRRRAHHASGARGLGRYSDPLSSPCGRRLRRVD